MKGISVVTALAIIAITASSAGARDRDNPSFGFCKSGAKTTDVKQCKEHGGTL
jgi:protein tyrosine phosphatase (PTP) superfamily phosphohydrolase (DUF442 family)